jgi:hypothetical protein
MYYRLDDWGLNPGRGNDEIFLFVTLLRPALRPIQCRIQCVQWESGRGVKLPTHLHLMSRLRMRGVLPPFSQYVFLAWYSIKQKISLHGRSHDSSVGIELG